MKAILEKLINTTGVSGNEQTIAEVVKSEFGKYCQTVTTDTLGNVIGKKISKNKNAKTVMIEAHMDEVGLIVTKICENGFLRFAPIGGIDPKILPSAEVTVHGEKDIYGVIGAKPPHLSNGEDKIALKDMAIDTGFKNAETFVSVGDFVSFKTDLTFLSETIVSGRCFDDRAGVSVIISVLEQIENLEFDFNLTVVATIGEELGLRGAKTAAYGVEPDVAISIDVEHGASPDASADKTFPLGSGPVITLGANIDKRIYKSLTQTAKREEIPFQIGVEPDDTGTNAWAIQVSRSGVPTGLLSVPLRYMHTQVETMSLTDAQNLAAILVSWLGNEVEQCF